MNDPTKAKSTGAGIVSYGAYVPKRRITPEEIGGIWGKKYMGPALGVFAKSVPAFDEDTITISVEAARMACERWGGDVKRIGAVYVGSESHPYAVKPSATVVAEVLGITPYLTAADFEFACKAGTAAMQTSLALVRSGMVDLALAIGADTSQGAPGDALEYTASAGGAAFLIGHEDVIATIDHTTSFTTDTPDFWRREGEMFPSHAGRFTGEPAYFRHVIACGNLLMKDMGTEPADYQYAVFHQPNGKFPVTVAKKLGFTMEQISTALLTPHIGNTYSGSVPVGLSAVLDVAEPGDRIFVTGYGSGAGSDAFDITVTSAIERYSRQLGTPVSHFVESGEEVTYAEYAKLRGKIRMKSPT